MITLVHHGPEEELFTHWLLRRIGAPLQKALDALRKRASGGAPRGAQMESRLNGLSAAVQGLGPAGPSDEGRVGVGVGGPGHGEPPPPGDLGTGR
ncbi:MAG TPA: hypothetical protein VIA06_00205 [Candidatus Dormibacteraeota bacterium]|jgi:hypothetical protein|nr:hypothetical protein [Candidatus Dormibacteraeota bacterium]